MIYVVDMRHRALINPVRQRWFGTAKPASTLVEVSALAHPQALLEVEAVVYAPR